MLDMLGILDSLLISSESPTELVGAGKSFHPAQYNAQMWKDTVSHPFENWLRPRRTLCKRKEFGKDECENLSSIAYDAQSLRCFISGDRGLRSGFQ